MENAKGRSSILDSRAGIDSLALLIVQHKGSWNTLLRELQYTGHTLVTVCLCECVCAHTQENKNVVGKVKYADV